MVARYGPTAAIPDAFATDECEGSAMKSRSARWWLAIGAAVLVSGLVVALSDAGLPVPVAVVSGALLICVAAALGAGVVGYRKSRVEGQGLWRSVGSGVRTSLRTVVDLF